jgi:hypothetical protein
VTEQNLQPTGGQLLPTQGPAPNAPQVGAAVAPVATPTTAPQYAMPVAPAATGARFAISRGFVEILAAIAAIVVIGGVVFAAGRLTAPPAGPAAFSRGVIVGQGGQQFPGGMMPGQGAQQNRGNLMPGQGGQQFPGGQQGRGGMMPGLRGQGRNLPGNGYGNGDDQGGFGRMGGLLGATGPQLKGQVVDVTADLLTLKLASGQTIQIALDGTTTYHKQATAAAGDVTKGSQVVVGLGRRGAVAGGTGGIVGGASDVTVVTP